jgi:hypothetical protein
MSRRLKITLPDTLADQLDELARTTGEPAARLAGLMVRDGLANTPHEQARKGPAEPTASYATADDEQFDQRARWLEPYGGDREWSMLMWGSICALHGRYPQALEALKKGWWKSSTHVETLCALVTWRQELDDVGRDPRDEIAFQYTLIDYGQTLRKEGGGVTQAWTPGPAPEEWRH